jgi:hypothetical protein
MDGQGKTILVAEDHECKRNRCAVPHLNCGQVTLLAGCRKPTEIIQHPSSRKAAEAVSTK